MNDIHFYGRLFITTERFERSFWFPPGGANTDTTCYNAKSAFYFLSYIKVVFVLYLKPYSFLKKQGSLSLGSGYV